MAESWRLKLERAEHHFEDFQAEASRYAHSDNFKVVPVVHRTKADNRIETVDYRLRIVNQPDPVLSVIAGDVLYNLRSALDHLAVGLVPKKYRRDVSFPIESEQIWARKDRRFVVRSPDGRRRFRAATSGMCQEAVRIIGELQPYEPKEVPLDARALYQLSRLSNADKHRQLVTFAAGLRHIILDMQTRGNASRYAPAASPDTDREPFAPDGETIVKYAVSAPADVRDSEIQAQVSGTPVIAVKVVVPNRRDARAGYMPFDVLCRTLFAHFRDTVFPALEPFVRR